MPKSVSPDQPELFIAYKDIESVRSEALADGDIADAAIEPHVLMLNALGNLREVSRLNHYVNESLAQQEPGDDAGEAKIATAKAKRGQQAAEAKTSFDQSIELLKMQQVTEEDLKELGIDSFSSFIKHYHGPRKHSANIALARLVEAEAVRLRDEPVQITLETTSEVLDIQGDPEYDVSLTNRAFGLRPHEITRMDSTADRLRAIKEDKRAGFYPKTNAEKVQVLSWLDYLDNPKKPLGIVNQLKEVFNKSQGFKTRKFLDPETGETYKKQKHFGLLFGIRALESITWEVGDYLLTAESSHHALTQLKMAADQDQLPKLRVADEFPDGHDGLVPFIQYRDIKEFANRERVAGLETDPLMVRQFPPSSKRPKDDATPGKRKTIYTQYNRPDMLPDVEGHISAQLQKLTMADIRLGIDEAIKDAQRQVAFHTRRLDDIVASLDGKRYKPIQDAIAAIREQELSAVA